MAPPLIPPPVPADLKATQQMQMPQQVLAGPGALKASGQVSLPPHPVPPGMTAVSVGAAPTVVLDKSALLETTPSPSEPKKLDEESIERRWFGG